MPTLQDLQFVHNRRDFQSQQSTYIRQDVAPPQPLMQITDMLQTFPDNGLVLNNINKIIDQGTNTVGITEEGRDSTSVRIWAGDIFVNRASAPFRVTAAGAITGTSGSIGGWVITATTLYGLASGTPSAVPADGIVMTSGATANITVYEDTEARLIMGNLSAGVYGIRGLATNGTDVIFELSDTLQQIAGWNFTNTVLRTGATDAASNVLIDSANSLMRLGPTTGNYITMDGANLRIRSSNYVTGVTGFTVEPGLLEAQNILARGTMSGTVFRYDVVSATGGRQVIANADALSTAMTALDASTLTTRGNITLAVNDILLIRAQSSAGIQEEYLRVTGIGAAPAYTVTRDLAGTYGVDANPAWPAGTVVVQQGVSDGAAAFSGGWLEMVGEASSGSDWPRISVFQRTGVAYNGSTERVRVGNLNGYLGYVADTFGVGIGSSVAGEANLTFDATNGLRLRQGTTNLITLDMAGTATLLNLTVGGSLNVLTSGNLRSGQTAYNTGTGFFMEYNAGTPRFSIGDATAGNSLTWDGTTLRVNGSTISSQDTFGDGSDGAATIAGDTSLTSDVFYTNLTVDAGVVLTTAGYRIFCTGTLTNNGTIRRNGVNGGNGGNGGNAAAGAPGSAGAAGTAGTVLADGSLPGSLASPAGAAGVNGVSANGSSANGNNGNNGTNGTAQAKCMVGAGQAGTAGGNGGNGSSASGGTAGTVGTAGSATGTILNEIRTSMSAYLLFDTIDSTAFNTSAGNGQNGGAATGGARSPGAGNGVDTGGSGGGGGAGSSGGGIWISARTLTNNGTISANGGNGGNGGNAGTGNTSAPGGNVAGGGSGGGAGGAAGNGGVIIRIYSAITAGTITVTAGTGGTGGALSVGVFEAPLTADNGTNGAAGNNGIAGIQISLQV